MGRRRVMAAAVRAGVLAGRAAAVPERSPFSGGRGGKRRIRS